MDVKVNIRRALKPILEREFVFSRYESFLKSISNQSKYEIVPLKDLPATNPKDRIVFALRHDVDYDLRGALEMAKIDYQNNLRATYFILHTASYYGVTKKGYAKHKESIVPILQKIQNDYGHEIGWHNDLVTLELLYEIDPKTYLAGELQWLRNNGINIVGTASHGSIFCHKYKYHNKYFFYDFSERVDKLPNNEVINIGNRRRFITKAYLKDFGFEYEAYHLEHNLEVADCFKIGENKRRLHPGSLKLEELKRGEKIIILTHPVHWGHSVCQKYLKLISLALRTRHAV